MCLFCFFFEFFHVDTQKIKNTHGFLVIDNKTMKQICIFNSESPKSLKHVYVCYSWKPNVKSTYVFLLRWNNVPGKNIFWLFLLVTSSAVAFLKPSKKKFRFRCQKTKKHLYNPITLTTQHNRCHGHSQSLKHTKLNRLTNESHVSKKSRIKI